MSRTSIHKNNQSGFTESRQQGNASLQRSCACGAPAGPSGQCIDCGTGASIQRKMSVNTPGDRYEEEADRTAARVMNMSGSQRSEIEPVGDRIQRKGGEETTMDATGQVESVLRAPGAPLDGGTRKFMEPRFGHDFSEVRIHTGSEAAASADSINARAYTAGNNIVFSRGAYNSNERSGQELLAHELTHVIQQKGNRNTIQRRKNEFDDPTLQAYLQLLRDTGKIEGTSKSDNKAREIVEKWKAAAKGFELTPDIRIMLIREMMDGPTLDEDEQAIFDILRYSEDGALRVIFGPGGINPAELNDEIHGQEWKQLEAWYNTRFKGGLSAVLSGTIDPQGGALSGAPVFSYSRESLFLRLNETRFTVDEVFGYIQQLQPSEQDSAVNDILVDRKRLREQYQDAVDKKRLASAAIMLKKIERMEAVLDLKMPDRQKRSDEARKKTADWLAATPGANLTPKQKIETIKESLYGYSRDVDESSIVDILENSESGDLRIIFGSGGIDRNKLYDTLTGKNKKRFETFIGNRYDGTIAEFLAGTKDFKGLAAASAPVYAYDWAELKLKIEGPYLSEELYPTLAARPEADRSKAISDMSRQRVEEQKKLDALIEQKRPDAEIQTQSELVQKYDEILQYLYKDIAIAEPKADLLTKTRTLTADEKKKAKEVLKPEVKVDPITKTKLKFTDKVNYEADLRTALTDRINSTYANMVTGKGDVEHADATKMHSLKRFEEIGIEAKKRTDAVFGDYNKGKDFKADEPGPPAKRGNIHDLWADLDKDIKKMSKAEKQSMAKALVFYFFQSGKKFKEINNQYNADPSFNKSGTPTNKEAEIQNKIASEYSKKDTKRLNEIDRGWPATAQPSTGDINFQLFKAPTVDEDRSLLWDVFQTFIHEYLHTLSDQKYRKYANSFGDSSKQYNTLIEGVDSFLTEIVWANVKPNTADPALRTIVEGPVYAALPYDASLIPSITQQRYNSYIEAAKLVDIVGVRNLYAAYFLGKTELIGA